MKKEIYLFIKFNEIHLSNTMLSNWLKCFTIQISINDKFALTDEDSSLLVKKD